MNVIASYIVELYREKGEEYYGEGMTVNSHSIQCFLLAIEDQLDSELVLAAFLHDIGHLLSGTPNYESSVPDTYGLTNHDELGAEFLHDMGLCSRICEVVGNHVASKRYLCGINQDYMKGLSKASQETLVLQGGVMKMPEVQEFEQKQFFNDSITIRLIDDRAKDNNFTYDPDIWEIIKRSINNQLL